MPSCAATPLATSCALLSVGQPDDPRAEPQRDLDRGRVHAADLVVAADAAEHRDAVDERVERGGEPGARRVVALEHDRGVPGGAGLLRGLEAGDRPRPVRIGAEVGVEVRGSGQVDGHGVILRALPHGAAGYAACQVSTTVRSAARITVPSKWGAASAIQSSSVPGAGAGTGWVSTRVPTPARAAVCAACSTVEW